MTEIWNSLRCLSVIRLAARPSWSQQLPSYLRNHTPRSLLTGNWTAVATITVVYVIQPWLYYAAVYSHGFVVHSTNTPLVTRSKFPQVIIQALFFSAFNLLISISHLTAQHLTCYHHFLFGLRRKKRPILIYIVIKSWLKLVFLMGSRPLSNTVEISNSCTSRLAASQRLIAIDKAPWYIHIFLAANIWLWMRCSVVVSRACSHF